MSIEIMQAKAATIQAKKTTLEAIIDSKESDINTEFAEYSGVPLIIGGTTLISAFNTTTNTLDVNIDGITTHTVTVKAYDDGRIYYSISRTQSAEITYIRKTSAASAFDLMQLLDMQSHIA
jgi:hypothetical protein